MDATVRTSPVTATTGQDYSVPLGYLRAFVTFLVVAHHSLVAYMGVIAAPSRRFAGGMMLWRAIPVVDRAHWAPASVIVGINDVFFMSLMFLISGLFVSASVARKGRAAYLRDRVVRLGIPFLFCAFVVVPRRLLLRLSPVGRRAPAWRTIGMRGAASATGRRVRHGSSPCCWPSTSSRACCSSFCRPGRRASAR